MTAFEVIMIIAAYFIGRAVGERRARKNAPTSAYADQNRVLSEQQLRHFTSLDNPSVKHILTGQLSDWQQEMVKRDSPATS